jgi:integrase
LTRYGNLSAYLGWSVDEGYLEENPARDDRALDPLPEDDGRRSGDEQAWSDSQRLEITDYVDERVQTILDDVERGEGLDAKSRWEILQARRDRALVYLFAYSGIRVGELLKDGSDDRRTGVTWSDLEVDDNRLTVLSKRAQETWSDRSLPGQTISALEHQKSSLEPPNDDWPIFPSMHRPTLYKQLRAAMAAAGLSEDVVKDRIDAEPTFKLLRKFEVTPPSMTTAGARRLMKRLTNEAGIEVDDRHGYLTPHGGRRGIGEVVVRQNGFAAAARFLDDTERMVRERYSHIEARELAAVVTDAIEKQNLNGPS